MIVRGSGVPKRMDSVLCPTILLISQVMKLEMAN